MKEHVRILYDQEADVLYFSTGKSEFTDYVEVNDDFILRVDPTTKKVVGFTIIDFAAHFAKQQPSLAVPLKASLERV